MVFYSCNGKAAFSASLLQSSVSHDPSEIGVLILNNYIFVLTFYRPSMNCKCIVYYLIRPITNIFQVIKLTILNV